MNVHTLIRGLAVAAVVALPSVASAAPSPVQIAQYNGYGGGYSGQNGGFEEHRGNVVGVVAYFSGFNLDLANGPHVNLHQGTVINPTGATLHRGMQIAVRGRRNRDGSINADVIDIVGGERHHRDNY